MTEKTKNPISLQTENKLFCSGELNRWFIVHAIFRENTIENQILCIVRFEVYALSPLNLDVKCVQVNDLFILQGDIVFI